MFKKFVLSIAEWFNAPKPKQMNFLFCDCGHELIGNTKNPTSLLRDVQVEQRNVVHYHCKSCQKGSYFDFDHFVPIPLPFTEHDDILEKYHAIYQSY